MNGKDVLLQGCNSKRHLNALAFHGFPKCCERRYVDHDSGESAYLRPTQCTNCPPSRSSMRWWSKRRLHGEPCQSRAPSRESRSPRTRALKSRRCRRRRARLPPPPRRRRQPAVSCSSTFLSGVEVISGHFLSIFRPAAHALSRTEDFGGRCASRGGPRLPSVRPGPAI